MYREMKALLSAKLENGEDGKEIVDGALYAIHEFIRDECGLDDMEAEWKRVSRILTTGKETE